MYYFVGYDDPYYQWIVMGMLAAFHVEVRKGYGSVQPRDFGYSLYF